MIANDQEFQITTSPLGKLRAAVAAFDIEEAAKRTGSPILAKAELAALKSEVDVLAAQLREYEQRSTRAATGTASSYVNWLNAVHSLARPNGLLWMFGEDEAMRFSFEDGLTPREALEELAL